MRKRIHQLNGWAVVSSNHREIHQTGDYCYAIYSDRGMAVESAKVYAAFGCPKVARVRILITERIVKR